MTWWFPFFRSSSRHPFLVEKSKPVSLSREELPAAVLFRPDHEHADLDGVALARTFGFTGQMVAHDGVVAGDLNRLVRGLDELPDGSRTRRVIDEFFFRFDPAGRMAVAHLVREERV